VPATFLEFRIAHYQTGRSVEISWRFSLQSAQGELPAATWSVGQNNSSSLVGANFMSDRIETPETADFIRPLDRNRPVYECPKCAQKAMQFYSETPDDPERTNSFICHACGTTWEM
jgi:hypothetical protein